MLCNSCYKAFDHSIVDRGCVASCSHLFCTSCANALFRTSSPCPICTSPLTSDTIVAQRIMPLKGDPSSQYSLLGQDPEAALSVSFTAIQFYIQQQQVYATEERKVLEDKLQHTKHHAKQKLAEFQSAYKQAKAECAAEHKRRLDLQADQKELLEKYNQRATQNDRVIYTLKHEIETLKRSHGGGDRSGGSTIPPSSSRHHQHQQQTYPINNNRFRSPSPAIATALQQQPTMALRKAGNRPFLNNNNNTSTAATAASPLNALDLPASPTNGFFASKTPVSMFPPPPPQQQQQTQRPPMLHSGSSLPRRGSINRGPNINHQIKNGTTGGLYGMFANVPSQNKNTNNTSHRNNHRSSPQPHAPTTSTSFSGSLGGDGGGAPPPPPPSQRQQQYGGRRGAVTPAMSTGFSM